MPASPCFRPLELGCAVGLDLPLPCGSAHGQHAVFIKTRFPSGNAGQGPLTGTCLALPDAILPTGFKLGCFLVARECVLKLFCLPAQTMGCCQVAAPFMELMCVTGCAQHLKCFDENAFVLKAL